MSEKVYASTESTSGRSWLKAIWIAVLVLLAIVIGACLWETVSHVGDVGMDDIGRQVLCQTLDQDVKVVDDVRVICEGFHRRTMVISMKNSAPIVFGRLKPSDAAEHMKRPYSEALEGLSGLILRGDKLRNTLDDPTPISEIQSKLQRLGARTVANFYAACGFEKFLIRDEEQKLNYLEVTFSPSHYGSNPVSIR